MRIFPGPGSWGSVQASHACARLPCARRIGRFASAAAAIAIAVASPSRVEAAPSTKSGAPASSGTPAAREAHTPGSEARPPEPTKAADATAPDAAYRDPQRRRWFRCRDAADTCERPGPARLLLLSLGVLAGGAAAGILFAIGDRHAVGDPATLLVGTGAVAGAGAIVGMLVSLRSRGAALPDRVRPSTADLAWTWAQPANLGEREPQGLALRWAPTYRFSPGARVRLIGHFGGWPGSRRQVDPRPQVADPTLAGDGTAPVTFRQRRMSAGIGLDLAVALPYPAAPRSAFLGQAELRWKPMFEIRRESTRLADGSERVLERTMLLPITAGARWYVSPRQRFTFYVGPRFDLVAYSASAGDDLSRGRPFIAPLYGEAWYDIDVPLVPRRARHRSAVDANGMITLGYVHSRFDGLGLNFGPVIGFLGPVHAGFMARVRPHGSKVALQTGAAARIGNGVAVTVSVGIVAPDLGPRRSR